VVEVLYGKAVNMELEVDLTLEILRRGEDGLIEYVRKL
jgi:hypothetical protein